MFYTSPKTNSITIQFLNFFWSLLTKKAGDSSVSGPMLFFLSLRQGLGTAVRTVPIVSTTSSTLGFRDLGGAEDISIWLWRLWTLQSIFCFVGLLKPRHAKYSQMPLANFFLPLQCCIMEVENCWCPLILWKPGALVRTVGFLELISG